MTRCAIIIPARFASTRCPGKPLIALRGADGESKTLIQRSFERASSVPDTAGVWVATDDERIAQEVRRFGGRVIMTSPECANGTERCAEAAAQLGDVAEIVVNFQGDAPLLPESVVGQLVDRLREDPDAMMATPAVRCSPSTYAHLATDAAEGRVGGTTVVFSKAARALYFSKRMIPYVPSERDGAEAPPVYMHLGLYAYQAYALERYRNAPPSGLEQLEGLEQLRFLDEGMPVSVVAIDPLEWDPIELNNPSDVAEIERILAGRGIS